VRPILGLIIADHFRLKAHMHRIGMADDAECRWCAFLGRRHSGQSRL